MASTEEVTASTPELNWWERALHPSAFHGLESVAAGRTWIAASAEKRFLNEVRPQSIDFIEAEKPKEDPNDPLLRCRRFGYQKKYRESENHDTFCRYHVKPPVFHETAKYWSCCSDKKAYDWETFMAIPGCSVGRCSTEDPGKNVLGGSDVRAAARISARYSKTSVRNKNTFGTPLS